MKQKLERLGHSSDVKLLYVMENQNMETNEMGRIIQDLLDNPKHVDYYYKA